ncbi:protein of unknown function DUF1232 [Syntrophobotulus glycolicus DSM 8271]|uniref:DUF1232 domain-containing protein n=1 Tax=Syntrophobotulus glycolicus (strain DSM 8271 / FlGlyR) TaxID=645991 RepID=F0T1F4_SYNGF|nr:DUF1232 domain-containing protein [Syntrophobotulus glycolicus]ADY56295.1 protein of unknown function DUF1232 [Syntrophobotulus glycolicus DSM 8271]
MKNNEDFYQSLRGKIRDYFKSEEGKTNRFAEYVLLAPDLFHLLCKLTVEQEVNVEDKAKLAVAIAYFVSPVDLIPEILLGPAGYLDDVAIAAFVLNSIINNTAPEVISRHWAGEGDILIKVKEIIKIADNMVGKGVWNKIKAMFANKGTRN